MTSILLAVAAATLAWSASAQDAGTGDATDNYVSQISQQCPDKLLQYLSPADLRDGLDDWVSSLSQDQQDELRKAEQARCAADAAGASCVNIADIGEADRMGLTGDLAGSICGAFLRCRSQGDCDHAR
jgi:hypothetical protein